MGLLTADQRLAIESGSVRYRQRWLIGRPASAGSDDFAWLMLHDDLTGPIRVTDPGERETEGYNQSLRNPGRMPTGLYRIAVANADGLMYTTTAGNVWLRGAYQCDPLECRLAHVVYVRLADGTWSEMTMVSYIGRVVSVDYSDDRVDATITSRALVVDSLERQWLMTDGTLYDTGVDARGGRLRDFPQD